MASTVLIFCLLIGCLLIGCVAGLRSLTAPALVCWAARLGGLRLAGTSLGFLAHPAALVIFTLLAIGELVADKLPNTPARTAPPGLIARILLGGLSGAALALSAGRGIGWVAGLIAGVAGALIGTYGGYSIRHALVTHAHLPDLAVALTEDIIAIGGGLLLLSRF